MIATFQVTNVFFSSDKHWELFKNRYYGYLENILELYSQSFKVVIFKVCRYRLHMNEPDLGRKVIEHVNVFTMINTKLFDLSIELYILPSHCE